jgi:hypothetical protein
MDHVTNTVKRWSTYQEGQILIPHEAYQNARKLLPISQQIKRSQVPL